MLPWILLIAAAQAGWTQSDTSDGCVYYRGADEAGVTPIRVECDWSDIPPDAVHTVLAAYGAHADTFSGLGEAKIIEKRGAVARVYQRFVARGATDREVVVQYRTEAVPEGRRYSWTKDQDQAELRGDAVEVEQTRGKWEVIRSGTGTRLTYELRIAIGGAVPGFLIKWFQGSAIKTSIRDLKRKVTGR